MLYYTISQGWEFAAMALTGAVMGAVSLAFYFLRRLMRVKKTGCLACDCLMGLVWALIACLALVCACRGRARAYHFAAMAAGGALFMGAVSPAARRICARICCDGRNVWGKLSSSRVLKRIFK